MNQRLLSYIIQRVIILALCLVGFAFGQEHSVRGKITYIAGDVIYTSIGRDAGIRDSSFLIVLSKGDTIAQLKVFALSSKSSACSAVSSKRHVSIDDIVIGTVITPDSSRTAKLQVTSKDTATTVLPQSTSRPARQTATTSSQSFLTLHGRISAQYFTNRFADYANTIKQPGMVVNLRGSLNNTPIKFELFGNLRTTSIGSVSPFSSGALNQSRIYRASIQYDDTTTQLALGRITTLAAPSIGYFDGGMIARHFGNLILGGAAGFEPSFSQRSVSTDMKKFAFFASYANEGAARLSLSTAYSRRYFQTHLDREVVSASMSIFPSSDFFFMTQSDIDLRKKSGDALIYSPRITSLFTSANYRVSSMMSVGAGVSAWRPTYAFSAINLLADSLIDSDLQSNPSFNVNFFLPYSISLYSTYSPRSSRQGFGKEYSHNSSIGISNVGNQEISLRATMNASVSNFGTTRGYGTTVQKHFSQLLDVTFKYQEYRYAISTTDESMSNHSFGLDILFSAFKSITLWGSIERSIGQNIDGYTILSDLSWSF
jgi:hypothetical protein